MANVLSIVPYKIFPAKFGGQKGIANFNEYFSRHQNLYCITVKGNPANAAPYTIINKLSDSRLRYINIYYFFLLKKLIRQYHISHIILEHPYYGWLAVLLKKFCHVKLIVHSHNIEAERFRTTGKSWWKILWRYEKYIHSHADFTFCITEKDRQYFIDKYKLLKARTAVITFGISWDKLPSSQERIYANKQLKLKYNLSDNTILYLFNGALEYYPNLQAVNNIVEKINPLFIRNNLNYKIIICGKNLPAEMNELKQYAEANIIYAGFVEDINIYFKGVDVFINPVTDGGGIKTKLVEALGYNLNAVSTINGAIGIDQNICNGKLLIAENDDWLGFSERMKEAVLLQKSITDEFFNQFYWDNIAKKAAKIVDEL
jgi:glycosyltransferase involved in cell wall biosynthesis